MKTIKVGEIYKHKKHPEDRWWDRKVVSKMDKMVAYRVRQNDEFNSMYMVCGEPHFKARMIISSN